MGRLLTAAPSWLVAQFPAPLPDAAAEGWSLAPAGGGRPSLYGEGAPGTVLQDAVSVTHRSGDPVTVRLHGTGVTLADGTVRVPARTRADVPFTVTVPAADRTVQIVARVEDGSERRVPVRLRVAVAALSALTVEYVAVRGDRIAYELVNRGTTTLVPTLTEPWPSSGRPALDAVDVRLTVTAAGGASDTAAVSARFVPWGAVAVAAGAMGAVGAFFGVRHRRRRGPYDGEATTEPERPHSHAQLAGAGT